MLAYILRVIHEHTLGVLGGLFLIGLVLCVGYTWSMQRRDVNATAFESTTALADVVSEFRTLYASEVVSRARANGMQIRHDYEGQANAIPLPATLSMILGRRLGDKRDGTKTRLYSPYPFPHRQREGGLRDSFGRDAWQALQRHPSQPFARVETVAGERMFRLARADVMRAACVGCHNSHPESPKRDWKVGDVRGIIEVALPIERAETVARATAMRMFGILAVFVVLGIAAMALVLGRLRGIASELEAQVRERTRELRHRSEDMRTVLDNVLEGVFTIDLRCIMSDEQSAIVERWFGAAPAGTRLFDYLQPFCASFAERSRCAWQQVVDAMLAIELTLDQMPKQLVTEQGKYFDFRYSPIGAEPHERFLVTIRDVSDEVLRAKQEEEQREVMEIVGRILSARATFLAFFDDTSNLVQQIAALPVADDSLFKRLVHTLKGNTAIFGLPRIAELCHDVETALAGADLEAATQGVSRILTRWAVLRTRVHALLGRRDDVIEVDPADQRAIEQALRKQVPRDVILRMVHRLRLEAVEPRLRHLGDQAVALAARLGKELQIRIEDNGVRVDSEQFGPFWQALLHLVRNAVDHGVEMPDQRLANGKNRAGTLRLAALIRNGKFVIELEDDGAGIDWDAVRRKASDLGLPAQTNKDLENALLSDGVSTAREVSDVSGRGVGFGAAISVARSLGGACEISSVRGQGTCIQVAFDEDTIAPELAALLRLSMSPRSQNEQLKPTGQGGARG